MTTDYLELNSNNRNDLFKTIEEMYNGNELTDVTLYCCDYKIEAHRIILSAASLYIREILNDVPLYQRPVIILNDYDQIVVFKILEFIYKGEICIENTKLDTLLKCAQALQITSLVNIITNNQITETPIRNVEEVPESSGNNTNRESMEDDIQEEEEEALQQPPHEANDDVFIKIEPDNNSPNDNCDVIENVPHDFKQEDIIEMGETQVTPPDIYQGIDGFPDSKLRCNVCGKVFVHPYSLHHHRAVHSGGTQCPICNLVLARKYNLKMHMRARHSYQK